MERSSNIRWEGSQCGWGGDESWDLLSYLVNSGVVGQCYKHQSLSGVCKLGRHDPSPSEGSSRTPVDVGRTGFCSKPVCSAHQQIAAVPPLAAVSFELGSLAASVRQGAAWWFAVLARCMWVCSVDLQIERHGKCYMSQSFRLLCT